jgi:phosphinothricin acetyltransferase
MEIRPATVEDLSQILEILNREIAEGVAHFGTEPQTLTEIRAAFEMGEFPWFVAVEDSSVQGFAKSSPWKSRGAYRKTIEVGVYVRPGNQGKGIGKAIYDQFIPANVEAGFHTLLAGIRLPNDPCVRLHESFGFRHVGTLPEVGYKFDQWHDVGYWAMTLKS